MRWTKTPPDINKMSHFEEFYFIRGGNFNRPVMVRCNAGVNSKKVVDHREYWPEININFLCENMPDYLWLSQLHKYNLQDCEWAGPIIPPKD